MAEPIRLNLDLDDLLPGDIFTIGKTDVLIRPLSLIQYKLIISKVKALVAILSEQGVTGDNFKEGNNLIIVAETIIEKFPELLQEVSGIHKDDLQLLPIEIIVSLIEKCLDVNMKAKDSLLGNFNSLAMKISNLGLVQTVQKSPGQSKK